MRESAALLYVLAAVALMAVVLLVVLRLACLAFTKPELSTLITTQADLDHLHWGFQDTGWFSIAAENQHGRPLLIWECENGDLWGSDGSAEDGQRPEAHPAANLLPFRVLGSEAALALRSAKVRDV